jgi:hypothetical protein
MWCGYMWSRIQRVFPAHILQVFIATSPPILIITISFALLIDRGQFAPLLVYFGYFLAIFCYFNSETISGNFNFGLGCAGSSANNAFSQFSITNNHNIINFLIIIKHVIT